MPKPFSVAGWRLDCGNVAIMDRDEGVRLSLSAFVNHFAMHSMFTPFASRDKRNSNDLKKQPKCAYSMAIKHRNSRRNLA